VSGNCITVIQPCVRVEMLDWLARRAELQNKPSWGKHGWPQIFQNEDGHWFGARAEWDFKAHISGGWKGDGVSLLRDDGEYLRSGTILGDWRDTLEKRPEEFKPFTSIEDNQDQVLTQQQDNGWFERGELPPVGTVCEVLWNEGRMEYLRTKVFGVNEHGQPIHRFDEGPNKFEYQADPLVTILGTRVFRPIRTERDVLIEIIKKTDDTDDKIADAILAAGFSLRGK